MLRFDNVNAQLKARDVSRRQPGREYLVALSDVPRTPQLDALARI